MKAMVGRVLVLWAAALACHTTLAPAQDYQALGQGPAGATAANQLALARAPSPWAVEDSLRPVTPPPDTGWEGYPYTATEPSPRFWTVDYRVRSMFDSRTSYQFGTPVPPPDGWAPLSRLDFSLDSTWHGLEVGVHKRDWGLHLEWLTPLRRDIDGILADYDWLTQADPTHLDSLSYSQLRWNEGQMLDFGGEVILTDHIFNLPIEIWPTAGFRFQRFNMTGYDTVQIVSETPFTPPVGTTVTGDVITFNQQFYMGYVGGQLRTTLALAGLTPICLTFQGDWGGTGGYNVDHHLLREGDRFTMDSTGGGSLHLAFIAETPISKHFSVGLQAEHLEIRTTGTHRLLNRPLDQDETWDNGVSVQSDQTSLTGFLRACF